MYIQPEQKISAEGDRAIILEARRVALVFDSNILTRFPSFLFLFFLLLLLRLLFRVDFCCVSTAFVVYSVFYSWWYGSASGGGGIIETTDQYIPSTGKREIRGLEGGQAPVRHPPGRTPSVRVTTHTTSTLAQLQVIRETQGGGEIHQKKNERNTRPMQRRKEGRKMYGKIWVQVVTYQSLLPDGFRATSPISLDSCRRDANNRGGWSLVDR